MTQSESLLSWEGVLTAADVDGLLTLTKSAVCIGQRPGDFTLAQELKGGAAAWPTGRCFNEVLEVRWWPTDDGAERNVLILNCLPAGWAIPHGWNSHSHELIESPQTVRYLCVGQYDRNGKPGDYQWWEARYGRAFRYLDSPPPATAEAPEDEDQQHRVWLVAEVYEFADGRTQHRLMRFEHAQAKEEAP